MEGAGLEVGTPSMLPLWSFGGEVTGTEQQRKEQEVEIGEGSAS